MKEKNNKIKILKLIIYAFVLAICLYYIFHLFPIMKNITTTEGRAIFKEKIINDGVKGVFLLFGLECAQVFLVILPGEPLEILAGMCYGGIWGTIFILFSVFITTAIIFILVRKFGKKLVYEFFNKEKVDKIEKSKIFNNPKQIELILFILFFIPGTPKDLLVYIGGLLPIKPIRFILISTFARFPSIISSTLAGNNIVQGKWKNVGWIYLLVFGLIIGIFIIINIFDRNKKTRSALKEIQ